jgi:uncharacterized protein YndB with AHSA1/START domain
MPVIAVTKDPEALTMTVNAEFSATPDRVWQLWADPRQLERWWGPPEAPATFETHDFRVGGTAGYYMTVPGVGQPRGWWRFVEIDPPSSLVFEDDFADDEGNPTSDIPGTVRVTIEDAGSGRTRMSILNIFPSKESMEQLLAMGQEEGMTDAVNQIDAILAEVPADVKDPH